MKDILPIAAIALLIGAAKGSNGSAGFKRKVRLTYDCYKGCAWDNPIGDGCLVRDYDWTVTATFPRYTESIHLSMQDAEIALTNYINSYGAVENARFATKENADYDPDRIPTYEEYRANPKIADYWKAKTLYTLSFFSYVWPHYTPPSSQSWSFSNPESFYAEQAQKMMIQTYQQIQQFDLKGFKPNYFAGELLPLSEYQPEIIYTKGFTDCADKDMKLNILGDFIKQWVLNYLTGGAGGAA